MLRLSLTFPRQTEEASRATPLEQDVCSLECCATSQPVQMYDSSVLSKTRKLQGKKWRQFCPEWFKKYPWLIHCCTRHKAFCSLCRSSDEIGMLKEKRAGGGDAFISSGFDNWKKPPSALFNTRSQMFIERLWLREAT